MLAGCAQPPHEHTLVEVPRVEAEVGKDGNIEYWECTDCGKLFADAQGETEIAREDTVIPALEEPESPFILAAALIRAIQSCLIWRLRCFLPA